MSKTTNTPTGRILLNARSLRKTIANLKLSQELAEYLEELDAELHIVLSPNADGVETRVVERRDHNKTIASVNEIEKLSNYKAIVGKKLEENKKSSELEKEIAIYKNAITEHGRSGGVAPDRILESNDQRFRQFYKQISVVKKHMEVIDTLTPSESKTYLLAKAAVILKVITQSMVSCMGVTKFETEVYLGLLLDGGVPRWLEKKFLDVNFTKDVRSDALTLLFSKGNYMKSISLTRTEIQATGFLAANAFITLHSTSILELAENDDLGTWFRKNLEGERDLLEKNYDKFSWPMLGPGTAEEFLEPRLNRNKISGFTPGMAPKPKPGQTGFRPENASQKSMRDMSNHMGLFISTVIDFFHFIPRAEDPMETIWSRLFTETENWVITAENHLYEQIRIAPNSANVLIQIRNNSLTTIREILSIVVLTNLRIPHDSARGTEIANIIKATGQNNRVVVRTGLAAITAAVDDMTGLTLTDLENTTHLIEVDTNRISRFRGKLTNDTRKEHKNDRDVIRNIKKSSPETSQELKKITDKDLRKEIGSWIKENFRVSKVQLLAAQRAVAAVDDKDLGYKSEEDSEEDSDENDG